jgi:hypothetical protein
MLRVGLELKHKNGCWKGTCVDMCRVMTPMVLHDTMCVDVRRGTELAAEIGIK